MALTSASFNVFKLVKKQIVAVNNSADLTSCSLKFFVLVRGIKLGIVRQS